MIAEHWAMIVVIAILLMCWIAGAILAWKRNHPKPPEPTPWADSTKVAQEVREMEVPSDGRG